MSFDAMIRVTEVLLALSLLQASLEHLVSKRLQDQVIFGLRAGLCLWLITGWMPQISLPLLWVSSIVLLHRFNGPYNGGADKMGMLVTTCLMAAHLAPHWAELAMAYLAVQLILSYVVSGYVKIKNPDWRRGQALVDVYRISIYPVSESLRRYADRPKLLQAMSWAVMGFEVVFPLVLLHPMTLWAGLVIAGVFHLANALLFGLNRFFWIWLCAYPSLIWFQDRLIGQ